MCLIAQPLAPVWTVAQEAPLSLGILQARILEWIATTSRGSSQPRDWSRSPTLQVDSLGSEPPGKLNHTVWQLVPTPLWVSSTFRKCIFISTRYGFVSVEEHIQLWAIGLLGWGDRAESTWSMIVWSFTKEVLWEHILQWIYKLATELHTASCGSTE